MPTIVGEVPGQLPRDCKCLERWSYRKKRLEAPQASIVGYKYVEVRKIKAESRPPRPLRLVRRRTGRFASEALRRRPQAQPQNAVLVYFLNKYPSASENMDSGLELWPKSVKTTAPCPLRRGCCGI